MKSHNNSKVIFLCQTFESVESMPQRHVILPVGSSIFMPIINWISVIGGKEKEEKDLKKLAKEMMDEVVKLHISLNGKPLPINLWNFRVQTPAFVIDLPNMNIFGVPKGKKLVLVDGFWIFFQPLVNNFSIETFGACRSGKTRISVNYNLEIDKERTTSVTQQQNLIS